MMTTSIDPALLMDIIRSRRSFGLKQLSPEPIDMDAVRMMLEAANWAPSHGQTEPWRFRVFAGSERQALSDTFGTAYRLLTPADRYKPEAEQAQRDRIWQAPVWISLAMEPELDKDGKWRMPEWEELVAVGGAIQNAHLVASALGLGAKWTSGSVATHEHTAQFVGIKPPARLLGFLYVGKPAVEWPIGTRRPLDNKVFWTTQEHKEE